MASVRNHLHAMEEVFHKPTLAMLNHRDAKIIVACLRAAFTRPDVATLGSIPAPRLHREVSDYLAELAEAGHLAPDRPRDGAAWCRDWLKKDWLNLDSTGTGANEAYTLTANARTALTFISANEEETLIATGSRVRVIQTEYQKLSRQVDPDRSRRLADLDEQIAALEAERDRIREGGDIATANPEEVRGTIALLRTLSNDVANDCTLLGERLDARRREIGRTITADHRPVEVLDAYVSTITRLLDDTPEGRLFSDVVELYRNEVDIDATRAACETILASPIAAHLTPEEKLRVRRIVDDLPAHIEPVIASRSRAVAALKTQIRRANGTELAVDQLLAAAEDALTNWLTTASPRSSIDLGLRPHQVTHGHLSDEYTTFAPVLDPDPAVTTEAGAGELPDFSALRALGGPNVDELDAAVTGALQQAAAAARTGSGDGWVEAGDLFNSLPPNLRRPVEIPGLIDIIGSSTNYTVDPDQSTVLNTTYGGVERAFRTQRIVFTRKQEEPAR